MRFPMFAAAFLILLLLSNSDLGLVSCQSEKELLLELRNNLVYDSSLSTKLVNWNESSNFCLWSGVKCDSKNRVSLLDLSGESISAGINESSSLFKLSHLQSLSLAQNSFDLNPTELPTQFGQLVELRHLNLSDSGFSGQIPLSFSNLTRLVVLDLSNTMYPSSLVLENPNLGILIHNYTMLRELYLDMVNISANANELSKALSSSLPNLRVLSLKNAYLTGPFDSSLLKLKSLSILRLDGNSLSSSFPSFFADFPNLEVFTMSSSDVFGVVPAKLFAIKSLKVIDLGNSRDLEGSFPEFPINGSLQSLLLSYTRFSGNVSESIGNLRMLSNFDVRSCQFSGPIPSTIKNLKNLVYLDLSLNRFSGSLPSFAFLKNLNVLNLRSNRLTGEIQNSFFEGLENLEFLDMSENLLQGEIPSSLFALPLLKSLTLSNNSFSGSISMNVSSPLSDLDLSVNNLEGSIPRIFFDLQNLSSLSLSWNKFNGSLDLSDFHKVKELVDLDLSFNNLSLHVKEEVSLSEMFPKLKTLMLASCNLKKIPNLRNHSSLMQLDLSDNQLEGEIPNWLWRVGDDGFLFRFLNLSHNSFTHLQQPYNIRGLDLLDLHSNLLVGEIPTPPPSIVVVDFSSNRFSSPLPSNIGNILVRGRFFSVADNKINGSIPSSFCNATMLQILDLSNNTFNGKIPSCLLENPLHVLNLRRNILEGEIPNTLPTTCLLETLDLSRNFLEGKVPQSLTRCSELQVLNLGNNRLNDTFPCWLNALSKLRVLVIRFNRFHGNISCLGSRDTWTNLQIINFASNNISGVIPADMFRFLQVLINEDSMNHLHFSLIGVTDVTYQDSVTVTVKGLTFDYQKILTVFTSVDFSDNKLHGLIPNSIGEAKALYVLNFSRNSLSGHIPSSIGNLSKLESLDFSFNALDGEIPAQIVELTFLSFLNLSYNHLSGRIPQGRQMQTFLESSYIGNDGLCGFPLNKTCEENGNVSTEALAKGGEREEEEHEEREIYVSAAIGFVVGLGFIFGPLLFCKRWRRCFNGIVSRFIGLVLPRQDHKLMENEDW